MPDLRACDISFVDEAEDADLHEAELHLARGMAAGPRRLFAMGRKAAHECLASRGLSEPVLRGQGGQPLWPSFYTGSISHTVDCACATLAHQDDCAGLGIDIEHNGRRPNPRLRDKVCTPAEREWLADCAPEGDALLKLISAKEAVFKAFYPLAGVYLGFADAELTPAQHGYMGSLCKLAGPSHPPGFRFKVLQYKREDFWVSLVFLPRERA